MRVMVTGGAGYIGSHVVRLLRDRGDYVVVVDDLSTGIPSRIAGVTLEQIDLAASDGVPQLAAILRAEEIDAVVHLAARKRVDESVEKPLWYYRQNVSGVATVLAAMTDAGVTSLIFSSSAAVYGDASGVVDESNATDPINPYGSSKLIGEWLVADVARSSALRALSLRYFNVAGAGWADLADTSSNNLVPMVFDRVERELPPLIFGADYETVDGSCVRDYIHVLDLARAHLAALDAVNKQTSPYRVLNVGTGKGTSVREIVDAVLSVTGAELQPETIGRRRGDPAEVVASAARILAELDWTPRLNVDDIVRSVWESRRTAV